MKIGTHSGPFHADDVFACAALLAAFPGGEQDHEIVRTRDATILASCDAVVDVGGEYDPTRLRLDHHQGSFKRSYPNGIKLSSFGLVWELVGEKVCGGQAAAALVCNRLVMPIDASDNGQPLGEGGTSRFEGVHAQTLSALIGGFNPPWTASPTLATFDACFLRALDFARDILANFVGEAQAEGGDALQVEVAKATRLSHTTMVLRRYAPVMNLLSECDPVVERVIFQAPDGSWMVQAIPVAPGSFTCRRPLPQAWAGLRDADFVAKTRVVDAIFAHKELFICGARSREGAIALAKLAENDGWECE